MSDPHEHDDYPDDDCPNCGGVGFVYDCIDGCCEDAESGCDLCERRCDWCTITNPAKKPDDGLRQVLADALAKAKSEPTP